MTVLKIREKGGEASWLMTGSHVDRFAIAETKKILADKFSKSIRPKRSNRVTRISCISRISPDMQRADQPACNGRSVLGSSHRHKHGRRSEPRGRL